MATPELLNYVGGQWLPAGEEWIDVDNPATGEVIARAPRSPATAVDVAAQTAAILARHAVGKLPDLKTMRRDLPPKLATTLKKGVALDPADRFESAHEYSQAITASMRSGRPSGFAWLSKALGDARS